MRSRPAGHPAGVTLLEATLVLLVLIALVGILFGGTRAWREGSEKTLCLLNLRMVQQAVRGYSNLHGRLPGEEVPGLPVEIFGRDRFIEELPVCAGGGLYDYQGDRIPVLGELYMSCSLAESHRHQPVDPAAW